MRTEIIGDATLYCGDCRDILPMLAKVDAVVTDPPYGIRHRTNHGASWADTEIAGDHDTSARDAVIAWLGSRPGAFCGSWKAAAPASARGAIVWDKGPAFGMGDLSFPWKPSWELVFIVGQGWFGRRSEGVLRGPVVVSWESAGRVHPHQKPEWLMAHFMERLPPSHTICDPFMGSGTTGLACAKLGRSFVGIEIDSGHFDTACRRIEAAQREPDMFVPAIAAVQVQASMVLH